MLEIEMRFRYDFYVPSEIVTAEGEWPPLTVTRGGRSWKIMKPERPVDLPLHAVLSVPDDIDMVKFGFSQLPQVASFIPIECERAGLPELANTHNWPEALLLEDLLQWIRVLTHQFWVGIRSRGFVERRVAVRRVDDSSLQRVMNSSYGWGFGCERLLDEGTWREIGQRLSNGAKPRPAQVFLCDALNEVRADSI
jgi:hypothetical protein